MLLLEFERCHKWILYSNKLIFLHLILSFILSILLLENQLTVNCQEGITAITTPILTSNDLSPSASFNMDSVRAFVVRNPWFPTMMGTIPAKIASFMTIRALRQAQNQGTGLGLNQDPRVLRGLFGDANNGNNGGNSCGNCACNGGGGSGGNKGKGKDNDDDDNNCSSSCNCNGGNGDNGGDDSNKRTSMFFVGNGNIQVKNHGDEESDADESEQKHYTYQEIDQEKGFGNLNKDILGFNMFSGLIPSKFGSESEIYIKEQSKSKKPKKSKNKKSDKSKSKKKNSD